MTIRNGFVYFAAIEGGGPVKIGHTRCAALRRELLQVWLPYQIDISAKGRGNQYHELAAHFLCRDHHIRGEWFRPHSLLDVLMEETRRTGKLAQRICDLAEDLRKRHYAGDKVFGASTKYAWRNRQGEAKRKPSRPVELALKRMEKEVVA